VRLLADEFLLTKRQILCASCSGEMVIPATAYSAIVQCKCCGAVYEYNPKISLLPELVFAEDGKQFSYVLTSDVSIGRESNSGYITLRNAMDQFFKQDTCIRNHFVSRQPHAKITMKEEFTLFSKGDSRMIIAKRKCYVEDCGSKHGTSLNDCMLKPHETRELKHEDRITLAPLSNLPLAIMFKEAARRC